MDFVEDKSNSSPSNRAAKPCTSTSSCSALPRTIPCVDTPASSISRKKCPSPTQPQPWTNDHHRPSATVRLLPDPPARILMHHLYHPVMDLSRVPCHPRLLRPDRHIRRRRHPPLPTTFLLTLDLPSRRRFYAILGPRRKHLCVRPLPRPDAAVEERCYLSTSMASWETKHLSSHSRRTYTIS